MPCGHFGNALRPGGRRNFRCNVRTISGPARDPRPQGHGNTGICGKKV